MKIKTLIAAGGLGKRLQGFRGNESTKVLLEVNNTPMINLQIQKLIEWGLDDFVIITNPQYDQLIKDVTSSIQGISIDYVIQNEPKGISHAFLQAENKVSEDEAIVCVLGDNFFGEDLLNNVNFENFVQNQKSLIFTKEVNNPEEFGVASIGQDQKVIEIIEKPKNPASNLAVVGVYIFDYSMFNSKLSGSINIYQKTTKDLIAYTLVDPFTNFGNRIDANIGDMENKGIELTFNVPLMQTDDYENIIDFNIAFNDNVVTRLPDQQFIGGISGGVGNTIQTHVEGEAPYSFLVYQQVYDSSGRPIEGVYVDRNGDNIINDDDRYIKEDPFADIIMGLTNSIRYKDWDFSVTARASIGNYAYNNLASNAVFNAAASINNILNNIHSDYLSTGFMDFTENSLLSDHYIQEASFVKIDNISIGYNMTTNSGCKIRFFGSLQNVATFTDYEGIDPEIYGGIDNNFYPRPQTGVFGVTFEF